MENRQKNISEVSPTIGASRSIFALAAPGGAPDSVSKSTVSVVYHASPERAIHRKGNRKPTEASRGKAT